MILIEKAVEHMQSKLIGTKIFEKVYQLVELLQADGQQATHPHEYVGNGVSKPISITAHNGVLYFRKNGTTTIYDSTTTDSFIGCENIMQISIPIKIVAFKNKSKLPIDCIYSDDWLAEQIIVEVTTRNGALKMQTGASKCSINVNSFNTNSREILAMETNEQLDVNTKIACCSVDVVVSITIDKNCFNKICGYGEK